MDEASDRGSAEARGVGGGRRRARGRIAGWLAILLLALAAIAWLFRVPIATGVVDRTLAVKRVPARYHIEDLGLGRQRLTGVVLGDPAHPDLVADWIETQTDIGLSGPTVTGVRIGHARIRARWVDGRLSLGAIDRLLPAGTGGGAFRLPALFLEARDARARVETPAGVIGAKLTGRGRLDDGFRGAVALTAERLAQAGCIGAAPSAVLEIGITRGAPHVSGPVRAAGLRCGDMVLRAPRMEVDARLSATLDHWRGAARIAVTSVSAPQGVVTEARGTVSFAGTARATTGRLNLASGPASGAGARAGGLRIDGRLALANGAPSFEGRVGADRLALPRPWLARAIAMAGKADATPLGPLLNKATRAAAALGREMTIDADLAATPGGIAIRQAVARGASGARVSVAGLAITRASVRLDGTITTAGGGLPMLRVDARPLASGGSTGILTLMPYAEGDTRLALTPMRFALSPGGRLAARTVVTLDGPLPGGAARGLTLPLDIRGDWRGTLAINPDCAPVSFRTLTLSSLSLGATQVRLCPLNGAMVRMAAGRVDGGVRTDAIALDGRLGGSPFALEAARLGYALGSGRLSAARLKTRIGAPDRQTRIDIGQFDGRVAGNGVAGRFADAGGQIGNVPLILSAAAGEWRFAGGALALAGALTVSDAAAPNPRFQPLSGRDVRLTLAGNRILATGTLFEPSASRKVADVRITHDLGAGTGAANLAVPGIAFDKGFQPTLLTPLTLGVIADVKGEVHGAGHIEWTPRGVTSSGDFATDGTDLAAAFGPVSGIAGRIHFTDLLALESAPGQVATIRSINPGIAVEDGRIVYQTYAGSRILVSSGIWPFAGGELSLDPTLLDFSQPTTRHLTFNAKGVEARQFLQQFDFKNLDATGVFDGTLPMLFDADGGRIENGKLTVRAGGGTIAYVGDLTEKDLGTWGNFAFQALKSLRYRSLAIVMNGPLSGEMITEVRFAGVSQGTGAKSNFLIRRLQRLPIVFNIRIQAPFRGLLDTAQSFYDPKRLIERNLKLLLEEQNRRAAQPAPANPIQPPASETVP